jgi:hypothetical protein
LKLFFVSRIKYADTQEFDVFGYWSWEKCKYAHLVTLLLAVLCQLKREQLTSSERFKMVVRE